MDGVFLAAAGVMSVAFVVLLFLRELPLRNESGIAALAAERAAETGPTLALGMPASTETVLPPSGVASRPANVDHRPEPVIYGQVTKVVPRPATGWRRT